MSTTVSRETRIERVPWARFYAWLRRNVHPGEHGFVVGSTGEGKSYLARKVIPLTGYNIVVLDGKGGDDPSLQWPGFLRSGKWPAPAERFGMVRAFAVGERPRPLRVIVTKPVKGYETLPEMRDLFSRVLHDLIGRKGRDVASLYVDEAQIVSDPIEGMGLKRYIGPLIRTKRYDGMSVWQATQWPTWIGPSSSREATHRFAFRVDDLNDQRELAKKFGEDPRTFMPAYQSLRRFEFVYKHKPTGLLVISKVARGKGER